LADRLDVEPRFTEAFAGLLGDRLQCVIVEDPARGLELLDELKQGNKGRATISPLRPVADRSVLTGAENDARVIASLIDQIRFRAEDAGLVRALIGNAVVVETAKQALEVNAQYGGVTAVALDGTVVSESAVVAGGSGDNIASAMIEQKREIRQLTEWVAGFEVELTRAVEHHADVEHRIAELESALELSRKTLHERELRHVTAEKDLARTEGELERLSARHSRLVEESAELDARMNQFSVELNASRAKLEELRAAEQAANEALAEAEVHFTACKQRSADQASRVTERKVRIAQVREQLDAARGALQRLAHDATLSRDRLALVVQEASEAQLQAQETEERLEGIRETLVLAESEALDARRELETVRALLDQVRLGVSHHEGELRQFRTELSEQEERSRQHEMRLQKWSLEKAHLIQNVRERFRGLELPRVVGDYHARPAPDAEHRRRIDELSKLIDRMGPVNLDAQAEYEDAERRFSELNSQKEDIDKALMELDRAIKHMDRESKRRFKETFDAVNELFRSTFTRLFKGGRGELKLTDPEDILETGVDIIAQPPGKKLGNIELMSGGEKALTATALIFAIFQYRPSPFCILDEVDAPLDEANVTRYNEAIRAMTANSQFVVITHIKKTMQSVDVLYGVTMGEPGVSRLVSVKVNDEAKSRSEKTPSNFVPPVPAPELRFPDILDDEASVQVA
jgi:chromosome segregation protein